MTFGISVDPLSVAGPGVMVTDCRFSAGVCVSSDCVCADTTRVDLEVLGDSGDPAVFNCTEGTVTNVGDCELSSVAVEPAKHEQQNYSCNSSTKCLNDMNLGESKVE